VELLIKKMQERSLLLLPNSTGCDNITRTAIALRHGERLFFYIGAGTSGWRLGGVLDAAECPPRTSPDGTGNCAGGAAAGAEF